MTPESRELRQELRSVFGGNLAFMRAHIDKAGAAYNWQLDGNTAARFLTEILPHLRMKRAQAEVAIAWQSQHLPPGRARRGRMIAHPKDAPNDVAAASLLKKLEYQSIEAMMAA